MMASPLPFLLLYYEGRHCGPNEAPFFSFFLVGGPQKNAQVTVPHGPSWPRTVCRVDFFP